VKARPTCVPTEGAIQPMTEGRIILRKGDITRVDADAIVNASNAHMTPGGGVSGAIHSAGGPMLAEEGRAWVDEHGPLAPGEAAATTGGRLPARHVIHALGPVWHGGGSGEAEALASAYRNSIRVADGLGAKTVAFPSISTGIFGYPLAAAAPIAIDAVRGALSDAAHVREVIFVLFDAATYAVYETALAEG
jgi:O-acetyl-ADP-ribose deacetylase